MTAVLLLVHNIPALLRSADLRVVFRDAVEDGKVFDAPGCMFHFKHRKSSSSSALLSLFEAFTCGDGEHCCIIRIKGADEAVHFKQEYHGVPWYDKHGVECDGGPLIRISSISRGSSSSLHQLSEIVELKPPSGLPQGNVGTTHATILDKIQQCKLPSSVLASLAIKFNGKRKRVYSTVPPPPAAVRTKKRKKGTREAEEAAAAAATTAASAGAIHWHRRSKSIVVADAAEAAELEAGPAGGVSPGTEREDHDAEEWDRHISLNGEPGGDKDQLFEQDVSQPWEKGSSGLVFHTDASTWEATQNDFDESTADDVDVDVSGYYEAGQGDQGFRDMQDLRRTGVHRPHPGLRGRRHDDGVVGDRVRARNEYTDYTKGVGARILGKYGWKKGEALGKPATRQSSIASPLDAEGQHFSKRGLGYKGANLPQ